VKFALLEEGNVIITKELVDRAIYLVFPSIEAILAEEGTTWGPKWVSGIINAPGLKKSITVAIGSHDEPWKAEWGEDKSAKIAAKKLELAERIGGSTGAVVTICPWLVEDGEYLYPGGMSKYDISVGISGAMGWVDEMIANMIIECIIMLSHLETDRRIAAKEKMI
jgi:hypothetical protein